MFSCRMGQTISSNTRGVMLLKTAVTTIQYLSVTTDCQSMRSPRLECGESAENASSDSSKKFKGQSNGIRQSSGTKQSVGQQLCALT
jgi:hypothetical protein